MLPPRPWEAATPNPPRRVTVQTGYTLREMAGKPAETSACGPLTITRLVKDDGRALIMYARKTDSNSK